MSVVERLSTSYLTVRKPLLELYQNASSADKDGDIGFYSAYYDAEAKTNKYTGLFRDTSDGAYKLFTGLATKPTSNASVDKANGAFALASFKAGAIDASSTLNVQDATAATSTTAASAKFAGGIGVAKDSFFGGLIDVKTTFNVQDATAATSTTAASAKFAGGIGVAKDSFFGGFISVTDANAATSTSNGSFRTAGGIGVAKDSFFGGLIDVKTTLNVQDATAATSTTAASAKFAGGIGVVKDSFFGGFVSVTDANAATSTSDGSFRTAGGIGVAKDSYFGGILNVSDATQSTDKDTGCVVLQGGIGVEKNANIGGALGVTGAATLSSTLGVTGAATLSSSLTVSGNSTMTGSLAVNDTTQSDDKDTGCVVLQGGIGVEKNANIGGALGVTGAATLSSTLGVTGAATLSSSLTVSGNSTMTGFLAVNDATDSKDKDTGCVVLQGGIGVEKNANIGGALGVSGAATLSSTLAVTGNSTMSGALYADGSITQMNDNIILSNINSSSVVNAEDAGYASARKSVGIANDTAKEAAVLLQAAYTAAATSITVAGAGAVADYYKGWYIKDDAKSGDGIRKILASSYDSDAKTNTLTLASGFTNAGIVDAKDSSLTNKYSLFNRSNVGWVWDESSKYISAFAFPRENMNVLDLSATDGSKPEYANIIVGDLKVTGIFEFDQKSTAMVITGSSNVELTKADILNNSVIYVNTTSSIEVKLPLLSDLTRTENGNDYMYRVTIVNINSGVITVAANTGNEIEDVASFQLKYKWDKQTLFTTPDSGTDWLIE